MPVYNVYPTGTSARPAALLRDLGLLLPIEIHLPVALANLYVGQNKPIPPPAIGLALVDTGATVSAVDEKYLTALGLQPMGQGQVSTPAGKQFQNIYLVQMAFPGTPMPTLQWRVLGMHFQHGKTIALIGRDFLVNCVLTYNGLMGSYTICF